MKNPVPHSKPATFGQLGDDLEVPVEVVQARVLSGALWSMKLYGGSPRTGSSASTVPEQPGEGVELVRGDLLVARPVGRGRIQVSNGKRGANGARATKPPALQDESRAPLSLLADDVAPDAALLDPEVLERPRPAPRPP